MLFQQLIVRCFHNSCSFIFIKNEFPDEFGNNDDSEEGFPLLVEELASILKTRGWSLSLIVPPLDQISRKFDTKRIILNLDFIILKSFDFRRENEKIISHHAPLYSSVERDPSSKYRNMVNVSNCVFKLLFK